MLRTCLKTLFWPLTVHRWLNAPIEGEGWPLGV